MVEQCPQISVYANGREATGKVLRAVALGLEQFFGPKVTRNILAPVFPSLSKEGFVLSCNIREEWEAIRDNHHSSQPRRSIEITGEITLDSEVEDVKKGLSSLQDDETLIGVMSPWQGGDQFILTYFNPPITEDIYLDKGKIEVQPMDQVDAFQESQKEPSGVTQRFVRLESAFTPAHIEPFQKPQRPNRDNHEERLPGPPVAPRPISPERGGGLPPKTHVPFEVKEVPDFQWPYRPQVKEVELPKKFTSETLQEKSVVKRLTRHPQIAKVLQTAAMVGALAFFAKPGNEEQKHDEGYFENNSTRVVRVAHDEDGANPEFVKSNLADFEAKLADSGQSTFELAVIADRIIFDREAMNQVTTEYIEAAPVNEPVVVPVSVGDRAISEPQTLSYDSNFLFTDGCPRGIPLSGPSSITQGWATGTHLGLRGQSVDFGLIPLGAEVKSTIKGRVKETDALSRTTYGNFVVVEGLCSEDGSEPKPVRVRFAHLQSIDPRLAVGSEISRGQKIGGAGQTGYATGIHLHYEVDGYPVGKSLGVSVSPYCNDDRGCIRIP